MLREINHNSDFYLKYAAFYHDLESNPSDFGLRGIFRDFLEDSGNNLLAEGQAWQIENKKWPGKWGENYYWHKCGSGSSSYIPPSIFRLMKPGTKINTLYCDSMGLAEFALAMAIHYINNWNEIGYHLFGDSCNYVNPKTGRDKKRVDKRKT